MLYAAAAMLCYYFDCRLSYATPFAVAISADAAFLPLMMSRCHFLLSFVFRHLPLSSCFIFAIAMLLIFFRRCRCRVPRRRRMRTTACRIRFRH